MCQPRGSMIRDRHNGSNMRVVNHIHSQLASALTQHYILPPPPFLLSRPYVPPLHATHPPIVHETSPHQRPRKEVKIVQSSHRYPSQPSRKVKKSEPIGVGIILDHDGLMPFLLSRHHRTTPKAHKNTRAERSICTKPLLLPSIKLRQSLPLRTLRRNTRGRATLLPGTRTGINARNIPTWLSSPELQSS